MTGVVDKRVQLHIYEYQFEKEERLKNINSDLSDIMDMSNEKKDFKRFGKCKLILNETLSPSDVDISGDAKLHSVCAQNKNAIFYWKFCKEGEKSTKAVLCKFDLLSCEVTEVRSEVFEFERLGLYA